MLQLLRIGSVCDRVGVSKRQIYRWIKAGEFPRQRRLSHKVSVWRSDELDDWIASVSGDGVATRRNEKGAARKRPL